MDEARAMLDQLMGKTRDLTDKMKDRVIQLKFSDRRVCKYFLCGLCPYQVFLSTKSDIGKCPYPICGDIDAQTCKIEWDKLSQREKNGYGYENELLNLLEQQVKQCDRRIEKSKQRCDLDTVLSEEDMKKLAVIQKSIQECCDQCESATDEGDIEKGLEYMKQIEQLKDAANKITYSVDEKRKTVCEVSGNYMSSRDNDERLHAHFEGKQYAGWKMVRDKYAQLVAKKHGDSLATASKEDKRLGVSPERKRGSSRSKNDDDDKKDGHSSTHSRDSRKRADRSPHNRKTSSRKSRSNSRNRSRRSRSNESRRRNRSRSHERQDRYSRVERESRSRKGENSVEAEKSSEKNPILTDNNNISHGTKENISEQSAFGSSNIPVTASTTDNGNVDVPIQGKNAHNKEKSRSDSKGRRDESPHRRTRSRSRERDDDYRRKSRRNDDEEYRNDSKKHRDYHAVAEPFESRRETSEKSINNPPTNKDLKLNSAIISESNMQNDGYKISHLKKSDDIEEGEEVE